MDVNDIAFRDEAARIIQRSWRKHVDRQVFQYYKELLNFKASGDPRQLLKSINPREAQLLDRASGCIVRYRLGGDSFPPRLYYKIFTHRNVEDLCANSPKDYTHPNAKLKPAIIANNRLPFHNAELERSNWYKRVENNGWRPVTDRIFYGLVTDALTEKTSRQEHSSFEFNRVVRREEREKRRKEKRIKWLQKIYCMNQVDIFNGDLSQGEPDAEADELLKWTSTLDFDDYVRTWALSATSEPS